MLAFTLPAFTHQLCIVKAKRFKMQAEKKKWVAVFYAHLGETCGDSVKLNNICTSANVKLGYLFFAGG